MSSVEKKIEYACPSCGVDLAVKDAVEVRQIEYHEFTGQVTWGTDGKPVVQGDLATDSCSESDNRYAMCGACQHQLPLYSHLD